jgi:metal-responsive CopG/Arc/MetJ family transcriptional regulator
MDCDFPIATTVPAEIGERLNEMASAQYMKRATLVRQILIREVLKRKEAGAANMETEEAA